MVLIGIAPENKGRACNYLEKCLAECNVVREDKNEVVIQTDEYGIERLTFDLKIRVSYPKE